MEEAEPVPLLFAINGNRTELANAFPTRTLLTYLRTQTPYTGTKLGCGEGGCGACVVLVSRYNTTTNKVEDYTINSCLAPLNSINLCAITTIEGIGSSKKGLHAIQERFAGFHASQCGFCTPGMCMSVYGKLKSMNDYGENTLPKAAEMERCIQGNICRCTGYRPIADVCKSFGTDVDVEDLGLNTFWKDKQEADLKLLPAYNPANDPAFPQFLIEETLKQHKLSTQLRVNSPEDKKWQRASSLSQVFEILKILKGKKEVQFVVGNTSSGVYKNRKHTENHLYIDISKIPELQKIEVTKQGIEFGAAITISKFIHTLEVTEVPDETREAFTPMVEHLKKLASVHVRNAGSIGGNITMAQKFGFESDLATLLLGYGALVKVLTEDEHELIQTMDEFLEGTHTSVLVKSVVMQFNFSSNEDLLKFKTYRASPRPLGNAVAYVNAAFSIKFSSLKNGEEEYKIEDSRLAFGAIGTKHAIRAIQVEKLLQGKVVTSALLLEAIETLKTSLKEMKSASVTDYKVSLATGFLFKFFHEFKDSERFNGTLISGRQKIQDNDRHVLGEPDKKINAELQASGEAVFVDDIPSPNGCLHAAYVYSNKALAKVKGVNLESALASPGAVAFFGAKDIPAENVGVKYTEETLFAKDIVECIGGALGVMVADTAENALNAAKNVEVDYDTKSLGAPIITIEDAVAANSFFPFLGEEVSTFGDVSQGLSQAHQIISGEVRTPTQYFFYMETQAVLVVPDEDNCLIVYSSSQAPEFVQASISACLGIPMHNIRVITRRLGGGFGGKGTRACAVATACALAAYKLQRPVRMFVDRNTDMIMMGGREAIKIAYNVGFTSDGKITALQAEVFIQGGCSRNLSRIIPSFVLGGLKKHDWGSFEIKLKLCKTNVPSRSPVRAPGKASASFIADAIIEHVAAVLNVETYTLMEKNMHTLESSESYYGHNVVGSKLGFVLPEVWDELKKSAAFEKRLSSVNEFNSANLWVKRGLSIAQCTFFAHLFQKNARVSIFSDSSVVVEVGGVDMGQGLYTKVRQVASFMLSKLFTDDGEEGIPASSFRVVQADTISLPNGGLTAGSTASEASCEAVKMACSILLERLKPVKSKLKPNSPWQSLVMTAKNDNIDLSAQAYFVASPEAESYLTYGAAVTEVEVDVLTGEANVLRTDMLYDCGKSMNPAVDIGQIEGSFAQGLGHFLTEDYVINSEGRLITDGTWTYKPPTVDNLPKVFNIELLNTPVHHHRILSSKTAGEPPLLLASSVHSAIRHAVQSARGDAGLHKWDTLGVPATPEKVKLSCGLDNLEKYLSNLKN